MTPVIFLSEFARSCFSLWAFLLCLIGIFSAVLAAAQKQYRFVIPAVIPFGSSYFLWQVLFDIHLLGGTDSAAVSRGLGNVPWLYWLLFLCILSAASIAVLAAVICFGKRSVTPDAVKYCLDQMPCGVCLWMDSGRVLFSNVCMNRLCLDITGSALLDGNAFYNAVREENLSVGKQRWRFCCREVDFDGERLRELIASDVTPEYARTKALEKDRSELSRLNMELKKYTGSIDEAVRRQEILQAKVNIHDEMNRLMLSTVAADINDTEALDRIFEQWGQNALLLCMEADRTADTHIAGSIERLAEALKLRLVWKGKLPELSEQQKSLFICAAQEAIANAAKHAQAKTMEISFEETDTSISFFFVNDGQLPSVDVKFSGGLANLSQLAERQGASVSVGCKERFTLSLIFMKNQPYG